MESNEIIITDNNKEAAIRFFKSEYPGVNVVRVRTLKKATPAKAGQYAILGRRYNKPKSFIDTADGRKYYYKTEVEDSEGNWNDNYNIRDGFWIIHNGNLHHIYK